MTARIQEILKQWHEAHRVHHDASYPSLAAKFDEDEKKYALTGRKYLCLNCGTSGAFMLEISTGLIYGIKGYGTPDRKKILGDINDPAFDGVILYRDRFRRGSFDNRRAMTQGSPRTRESEVL